MFTINKVQELIFILEKRKKVSVGEKTLKLTTPPSQTTSFLVMSLRHPGRGSVRFDRPFEGRGGGIGP